MGALAAAVGGAGADNSISPWLESFGLNAWGSELVAITLVVAPITYLSVVVGELVPKSLAIRNSESISLATVLPLIFLEHLLSPVVNLFGHTRLPVFDGEGVIGILYAKEFFSKIESDTKDWKFLSRENTSIQMLTPVSQALNASTPKISYGDRS